MNTWGPDWALNRHQLRTMKMFRVCEKQPWHIHRQHRPQVRECKTGSFTHGVSYWGNDVIR